MLVSNNAVLLVIDVQGKLAQLMDNRDSLFRNLQILIRGLQILEVPVLWMEQIPGKLGPTIPEVAKLLSPVIPIKKSSFSCCGNKEFMDNLIPLNRKQVLLTGIETHICVYQTALDLLQMGYEVQVVADATSTRAPENKQVGLERIKDLGGVITSTEMVLFELMRVGEGARFKEICKIVK